jgi:predicted ABC-type ATPase
MNRKYSIKLFEEFVTEKIKEVMKEKTVYIVAGANGSGKTTFAKEFIKSENIEFLNADEIEKEFNPHDKEGGKIRAGRELFRRLKVLVQSDKDFIIESTLAGKSLNKLLKQFKKLGYKLIILYVFLDNTDIAIERVKIRVKSGGHNIINEDIQRRYFRSIKNFWEEYSFLVEDWQIFYNGEDNIIQTAMGCNDDFIIIDESKFDLFKRSFDAESYKL